MDIGLTNTNNLGHFAPELADVKFIVECDGHKDQSDLWSEWSNQSSTNIPSITEGNMELIKKALSDNDLLFNRIKCLNNQVKRVEHTRVEWEQVSSGFMLTIGHIGENKLPVCVSFSFAIINGHKVCFYYTTSRANDSQMVEDWFVTHFQLTHDNYTRWNHVDSNNFHNCINSLDRLDKEPRNLNQIDLMTPRAIRTHWYPGCKFKDGEILTKIFGDAPFNKGLTKEWRYWNDNFSEWIWASALESATMNFRQLGWWEKRHGNEMPEYVKLVGANDNNIFKVTEHNGLGCNATNGTDAGYLLYKNCIPITETQKETVCTS